MWQQNGGQRRQPKPGERQVQTLILALAFVLVGPSIAGSSDSSLPGIGTFAYTGSPMGVSASQAIVVAVR
jgi:hypothetical protein